MKNTVLPYIFKAFICPLVLLTSCSVEETGPSEPALGNEVKVNVSASEIPAASPGSPWLWSHTRGDKTQVPFFGLAFSQVTLNSKEKEKQIFCYFRRCDTRKDAPFPNEMGQLMV